MTFYYSWMKIYYSWITFHGRKTFGIGILNGQTQQIFWLFSKMKITKNDVLKQTASFFIVDLSYDIFYSPLKVVSSTQNILKYWNHKNRFSLLLFKKKKKKKKNSLIKFF